MKILVTGGAGFIGSHLCERLLCMNHDLAVIDDLNDFYSPLEKQRNLDTLREQRTVSFEQGDIRSVDFVTRTLDSFRPEAIIHLAARAGVRPSIQSPFLYEEVNVHGTMVLLEAACRFKVRRFVFASSSSVYGVGNTVPFREDDSVNRPVSQYAATKLAGENLCYTYSHLYGIQVVCLRFFTVYGPRQRPDLAIRKFIELIDHDVPIPMFGNGSTSRDYTFVRDTVAGIVAALLYDSQFEVFNLGNSRPITLRSLIQSIEETLGKEARVESLSDQPGDVPITYADITKAQRLLGYQPATTLLEGLQEAVAWYRALQNPNTK